MTTRQKSFSIFHIHSHTLTSFSHLQSSRQKSFGLNVSLHRSLKHIFLYMCGYVYVESIWHIRVTFAAYEEFLFTFFFYFLYDIEHKKLSFCEEKIIFFSCLFLRIFLIGKDFDNFLHLVCQSLYLFFDSWIEYY